MKKYLITEENQVLNEVELKQYFDDNITEYENMSDWVFDSIRYGLLKELDRDNFLGQILTVSNDRKLIIVDMVTHSKHVNILFLDCEEGVYIPAIKFDFETMTWKQGDEYSNIEHAVNEWQCYY